ncbi:hypothetical protein MNV49_002378 [Pseudohyphozyma bogoriensis]|nr:hypothetical protein MNV49_002378 [Pseudohyphozyma bogoriensis]
MSLSHPPSALPAPTAYALPLLRPSSPAALVAGQERASFNNWRTDTAYTTVTIQTTQYGPVYTTVYTTYGVAQTSAVTGEQVTYTVYTDATTTITLTPQVVIETLYPTYTSTVVNSVVEESTTYLTTTNLVTAYSTKDATTLATTTWVLLAFILGSIIGWSIFFVRHLLFPFKTLVVGYHEAGHILGFLVFGIQIQAIVIDPTRGGATMSRPGLQHPPFVVFAGFSFSGVFGMLLVFAGFNTYASKIASFFVGITWVPILAAQQNLFSRAVVVAAAGLMIGLCVYDTMDDRLHHKEMACCVVMIHSQIGEPRPNKPSPWMWFGIWFCQSQAFLATK